MPRVVPPGDPIYPRCNNRTRSVRRFPHRFSQHRQGDGDPSQVVRARRMGAAATRVLRGALRTRFDNFDLPDDDEQLEGRSAPVQFNVGSARFGA